MLMEISGEIECHEKVKAWQIWVREKRPIFGASNSTKSKSIAVKQMIQELLRTKKVLLIIFQGIIQIHLHLAKGCRET